MKKILLLILLIAVMFVCCYAQREPKFKPLMGGNIAKSLQHPVRGCYRHFHHKKYHHAGTKKTKVQHKQSYLTDNY